MNPRFLYKILPWYFNPLLFRGGVIQTDRVRKSINALGIVLSLDLSEYLDKMYALNVYDRKSLDFLQLHLYDCDYFFDLGANLGFYSLAMARHYRDLVCIMAEPDPYSVTKIIRNIELDRKSVV